MMFSGTTTTVDGTALKQMLENGFRNIKNNMQVINELNVFPVPDGDTGTNMRMTIEGGMKSVWADDVTNVGEFMQRFARGCLLGARGNSGIILSRFIKGISNGMQSLTVASTSDFSEAMHEGVTLAYDAVVNPVEGTILTVMREATEAIQKQRITTFELYFERLVSEMRISLQATPDKLKVLKDAGVIDSGGAGLLSIFVGMNMALHNEIIENDTATSLEQFETTMMGVFNADSELVYGYCTEFILQLQNKKVDIKNFDVSVIVSYLETVGDSIVAVVDGDLVKIHVHTFTPGCVIDFCQQFGEFYTFKMENMSVQHNETLQQPKQTVHKHITVAAVCSGKGIASYFSEIGADCIINGGQTCNPSTEDFIQAFECLSSDYIIVLPNNSNVILTAKQAAQMYEKANVIVVETHSIAEGYSALSMMDKEQEDAEAVARDMSYYSAQVTTGLITYALRDVTIGGLTAKKGDYIGLDCDNIISASSDKVEATVSLIHATRDIDAKQVITVFYGSDVTNDELERLKETLFNDFPYMECGFISGEQEIYSFILAIE